MKYIEIDCLSKSFKDCKVLDRINLTISAGDFAILQGKNGSGKSTLIKAIVGLIKADSGTIKLFNLSPEDSNSKIKVGVVLQSVNVPEKTSVTELINLLRSYYPNSLATESILEKVNLEYKKDDYASTLSGGQKQRLYFALALAGNPDLLILDEPTRNLDRMGCEDFWQQVKKCRQQGITILMVTNNQSDWQELDDLATRVISLDKGKIIEDKSLIEKKNSPKQKNIERYSAPSSLGMLVSQIKFESLQWWRDIVPAIGTILLSGIVVYLSPSEDESSKSFLVIIASIMCLTFAIDRVGSRIAIERVEGWENLLRITPLNPIIYLVSKIFIPSLIITLNLIVMFAIYILKTSQQANILEYIHLVLVMALGMIPFLTMGVVLGYLVKPKIFGTINGVSLLLAIIFGIIANGILTPSAKITQYLLLFSPFFQYDQLVMDIAGISDNHYWLLNSLWLVWLTFILSFTAIWSYRRERAIKT